MYLQHGPCYDGILSAVLFLFSLPRPSQLLKQVNFCCEMFRANYEIFEGQMWKNILIFNLSKEYFYYQPLPPAPSSKIPRLYSVPPSDTLHPKIITMINLQWSVVNDCYQFIFLCVIFVLLYQLGGEISQSLGLLSRSISPGNSKILFTT